MQAFKPDVVLDFICFTPQETEQVLPLVKDNVRQVVDWNEKAGLLDGPDDEIFDDRVVTSWQKCLKVYGKE